MISLFKTKFNWPVYLLTVLILRVLLINMEWYFFAAISISLFEFMLLFYSIGYVLPVRYIAGSLMCIQMLVGPTLAYNGLDQYQRGFLKMQIPPYDYFIYALPAVVAFILGLHAFAGKLKGEFVPTEKINEFVTRNPRLPYLFVGIGFFSSVASTFFSSELGFVFVLLGSFKYIGAFLLILGSQKTKPIVLALVYGSIILSSLRGAMFHDLITWLIFLGTVFAIKYRPSNYIKATFVIGFILIAIVIQQLKGDYRKAVWQQGATGGLETFSSTYEDAEESGGFFSAEKLGASNIRINQGFIITNIMQTVPDVVPYEYGKELLQILEAAILPRILAPNKLRAGDREIFMKYSGIPLLPGTSMGLSSMGDGYINFGIVGGIFFMFFYGMLFSGVLNLFYNNSKYYPILILFTPLVFYYPIRPDCELQTILGHIFKSCFLLFVMIQVWDHIFRYRRPGRNTLPVIGN